jgi:hypothetical protein
MLQAAGEGFVEAYGDNFKNDIWRVQAACIKLSNGNLTELKEQIALSNWDFREVLGPAERCGRKQYEAWLKQDRSP